MSIIPKTFTGTLLLAAVLLTVVVTLLLLLSYRRKEQLLQSRDNTRYTKVISWAMIVAATLIPIMVVVPNHSVSLPFVFFVLTGTVSALSAVYLALGGKSRMLLAYALVAVSVSMILSPALKNNFYPFQGYTQQSIFGSGNLAGSQTPASQGFYYFIPVSEINLVAMGEVSGVNSGIASVLAAVELVGTLLALWALFEGLGLKYAYPALFFIFSPELSFIVGRTDELVFVALVLLLVGLASTRSNRNDVLLLLPVISVGVFDHPIAPISIIAMFASLSLVIALRKARSIEAHHIVFTALRLALIVTAVYWFFTYIYSLILPHATNTFQASINFMASVFFGNQNTVLGGGITSALAPGYSSPQFRLFALIWAAPVAFAAAPIFVMMIRKFLSAIRKSRAAENSLSGFAQNFGIAASLSAIVLVGAAYAAYTTGTLQGQYLIPAGYFVAVVASAFAVNQLIGSRKLIVVGIALILIFSIVFVGTYSPDWTPLEHLDFQVSATIHPYTSYMQGAIITSLLGNHTFSGVYNDYDITVGSGGEYKPVRAVISSIDFGQSTFNSYNNSLFVFLTSRLSDTSVSNQTLTSNIVYFSNSHFVVLTG